MSALVSFFLISKSFDWLRAFEETSFLIMLISETIYDIRYFMVLFIISLVMFAFPLFILNNINLLADENPLIGDLTGFGPMDAILKQYEEVLAGFGPNSFAET